MPEYILTPEECRIIADAAEIYPPGNAYLWGTAPEFQTRCMDDMFNHAVATNGYCGCPAVKLSVYRYQQVKDRDEDYDTCEVMTFNAGFDVIFKVYGRLVGRGRYLKDLNEKPLEVAAFFRGFAETGIYDTDV